jgi:thioredoxin 1
MNINGDQFKQIMSEKKGTHLIDFWAEWCGPCKRLTPILERLDNEFKDKMSIHKVNVDIHPEIAAQMGVRGIPTMLLIKDGVIKETIIGSRQEEDLKNLINKYL